MFEAATPFPEFPRSLLHEVDTPKRQPRVVRLRGQEIFYASCNYSPNLLVPELTTPSTHQTSRHSSISPIPITSSLTRQHHEFKCSHKPSHNRFLADATEISCRDCLNDLLTISYTFPSVRDPMAVLAMAAWLSVLCEVDDSLEGVEEGLARECLRSAVEVLESRQGLSSIDIADDLIGNKPLIFQTRKTMRSLKTHITESLFPTAPTKSSNLLSSIVTVWQGYISEIPHRLSPPRSISEYLRIRTLTISIGPFFTLARDSLAPGLIGVELKDAIDMLDGLVHAVICLQNDIVGFEKDLKEEQVMSVVAVSAVEEGEALDGEAVKVKHVSKAVEMHNNLVKAAVTEWEKVGLLAVRDGGSADAEGAQKMADALIYFVGSHLEFAVSSVCRI